MMRISVSKLARDDLREVHEYLSEFGEGPPEKFRDYFEKFCSQIVDTPYMFSQYEYNLDYRKAVAVFDYLILYRVDVSKDKILVYRVLHGKRNIRPLIS